MARFFTKWQITAYYFMKVVMLEGISFFVVLWKLLLIMSDTSIRFKTGDMFQIMQRLTSKIFGFSFPMRDLTKTRSKFDLPQFSSNIISY